MKKIVIVVGQMCLGGAERVASLWATGFSANNYHVTIITDTTRKFDYEIPRQVDVVHFDFSDSYLKRNILSAVFLFRQIVKKIKPDILITVLYPLNILAKISTIGINVPIINTEHNAFERPTDNKLSLLAYLSKFYLNRFFNHVTVLTEADKKFIGSRLKNVSVLPNPLTFPVLKKEHSKSKIIVASGRLDAWYVKGFDVLIRAWGKVAEDFPDWKLKICGTGSEKSLDSLTSLARLNGVERQIEFSGFCKNIQDVYADASIFVLSSRCEGFGMVLIEAMSQKCACIACDYKGRQREIIQDDSQGIICAPDDIDTLAYSLKQMIMDDVYRKKCQENAVDRASFYSLDRIMSQWIDIFHKVEK